MAKKNIKETDTLFSKQSHHYAAFRFDYPVELYEFIQRHSPDTKQVWDCATGNGQAAINLATTFNHVTATDINASQINHAPRVANISFQVLAAEDARFAHQQFDAVCVAQAIHWIDTSSFYALVDHCLVSQGLLLIVGYAFNEPLTPALDQVINDFQFGVLKDFWPVQTEILFAGLKDLPFPYPRLPTPEMHIQRHWSLKDYVNYTRTWSATQLYIDQHGIDPCLELAARLAAVWPENEERLDFQWQLFVLAGTKPPHQDRA
ncbi:class I SAM-dependent methyltransferase [Pseudomonas sp. LB1P83]